MADVAQPQIHGQQWVLAQAVYRSPAPDSDSAGAILAHRSESGIGDSGQ